ncbi:MAG: tRNA 2-thiouridine(34) synthase MnmA [Rhodothermaceae bacterium]
MNKDITVAVGMSGGVDSSVTAGILKNAGYNVIGITMKIWDGAIEIQETTKHACYGPDEWEDIEISTDVCKKLDIPYHVYDLSGEYKDTVLKYFKSEYLAGRTPNPCVLCNQSMKFGFLIDAAKKNGLEFDYFATGHYAKILESNGERLLAKSPNDKKDQTYFLSRLKKEQLSNIMFPIGEFDKADVRKEAERLGLEVASREESQDFISGGDYTPLFTAEETIPGDIVDDRGNLLGRHEGIYKYTIGQRKGLGISSPKPMYVLRIDAKKNRIIVTEKANLFSEKAYVTDVNMLKIMEQNATFSAKVKIRQNNKESEAEVKLKEGAEAEITFDAPALSVTPGQIAVFYDNDVVLGSGILK